MPKSFGGLIVLGLTALGTVVLGLALYNRIKTRLPFLQTVTAEGGA